MLMLPLPQLIPKHLSGDALGPAENKSLIVLCWWRALKSCCCFQVHSDAELSSTLKMESPQARHRPKTYYFTQHGGSLGQRPPDLTRASVSILSEKRGTLAQIPKLNPHVPTWNFPLGGKEDLLWESKRPATGPLNLGLP